MQSEWQSVATLPPLEAGELQIWQVQLGDLPDDPDMYRQHLSQIELERADRLRPGQVRMQFLVARSCLRILLGNLLNQSPGLVPLQLSSFGKPEIPEIEKVPLCFNVAHSREMVLIALCHSEVGIDVEYYDRKVEALDIARTSFTMRETSEIEQATTPADRQRLFFQCWTRKEAVIKADGRGLSLPLAAVEVPVLHPALATAVTVREQVAGSEVSSTWFVTDLALGEDVAGAVATNVLNLTPRLLRFPPDLLALNRT